MPATTAALIAACVMLAAASAVASTTALAAAAAVFWNCELARRQSLDAPVLADAAAAAVLALAALPPVRALELDPGAASTLRPAGRATSRSDSVPD